MATVHPNQRDLSVPASCGCINQIGGHIDFCPLHTAAEEMRELLTMVADDIEEAGYPARADNIRALLAKISQ